MESSAQGTKSQIARSLQYLLLTTVPKIGGMFSHPPTRTMPPWIDGDASSGPLIYTAIVFGACSLDHALPY